MKLRSGKHTTSKASLLPVWAKGRDVDGIVVVGVADNEVLAFGALGISPRTAARLWTYARAVLYRELSEQA